MNDDKFLVADDLSSGEKIIHKTETFFFSIRITIKRNEMARTKKSIIRKIQRIIEEWGSFGSGEVEVGGETHSPCVNSMGNLVALAEYFNKEGAGVNVYDPSSMSCDEIDSYIVDYEELPLSVLEEILELCEQYEVDNEKTMKRISD